ncbi:VOC family protein [Virgibacillus necropolis]|uniref:VOC family protein n=1 Tax=Virgibacillus necropolis TaxID=163877 RepID=UPI00384BDD64
MSPIKSQINTIFVHVSNLAKSVEWYSWLLGQTYELSKISDPVYNMNINHHTGLTLDAGPEKEKKVIKPSSYPLFNFHTDDIHAAYEFVKKSGIELDSDLEEFDDFSFFTVKDPDQHVIMICTG